MRCVWLPWAYIGAHEVVARYDELRRRRAADSGRDLVDRISDIAAAGPRDRSAAKVLDETATFLGAGIADFINLFNPERIVVGGWVGQILGARLLPAVRDVASKHALRMPFNDVSIVPAELGRDAVALGAATLPMRRFLASGAERPSGKPAARSVRSFAMTARPSLVKVMRRVGLSKS